MAILVERPYRSPPHWLEFLQRFVTLNWIMNHRYDPEWDHFVRMGIMLDMVDLNPVRGEVFSGKIGGKEVWLANYPYSFGHEYGDTYGRPSIGTIRLLRRHAKRLAKQRGLYLHT